MPRICLNIRTPAPAFSIFMIILSYYMRKRRHIEKIRYVCYNLFNNLTLGNKEYKNDQLEQVIYDTGLQQVVGNYKESSNVKNLSGGEKQRVGVARALLKKSNIIFMDEGTSALDSVTASIVEKNILLDKDRTLVAVLHKFNETIKMYDVIYYIKDGYVKEAGSYIELMNLRGDFYKNIIGGENN